VSGARQESGAASPGGEGFAGALRLATGVAGASARRVRGWATVELDRAEGELGAGTAARSRDLSDDSLLGARCRLLQVEEKDDIVILEPATEGRLAASLAHFGEGPLVLYFLVPPDRFDAVADALLGAEFRLSAQAAGPFGRERLVLGGRPWGPQMLIAEDGSIPPGPGAATIGR
jgi:hypothetical protein